MAYKNETVVHVSLGSLGTFLLFLLFLGLKLGGIITWSWWWVTAPLWMPWAVVIAITIIVVIIYFFIGIVKAIRARNAIR